MITIAMRWTDRLVGFLSTLILARLLVPDDFGVIAMASVVVGLIDVFLDLGVSIALIRNKEATSDHYNTAWTLRLIQSSAGAIVVFFSSELAVAYFREPRIGPVLQVMSIGLVLVGLENIGVITFQKEMRFGMDFRLAFIKRISAFIVTIIVALTMRSYWALVVGALVGRSLGVLMSYQMHPMRPRLSLVKMREIFSISQWMLLNSIGNYINHNLHNIMVGRSASASIMGGYTLACEISAMPTTEVLAPLNRVLFPALVQAKHDLLELKRVFLLAQSVQSLVGIPAGIGLALVANEAVLILLGEKWFFVVPYVQILALANVVESITTSSGYLMITLNNIRRAVLINWTKVILFVTMVIFFLPATQVVISIAWIRVIAMCSGLFLSFWMLSRVLSNINLLDIARSILRPVLATVVMSLVLFLIDKFIYLSLFYALMIKIVVGLICYSTTILFLWWFAKKPDGAESYLLEKFSIFHHRNI